MSFKYMTLGFVSIFWILLPFVFQWVGMPAIEMTEFLDLAKIESPESSITSVLYSAVNWSVFYFKLLTLQLPGAPLIISIFLLVLLTLSVLALISVFRGD